MSGRLGGGALPGSRASSREGREAMGSWPQHCTSKASGFLEDPWALRPGPLPARSFHKPFPGGSGAEPSTPSVSRLQTIRDQRSSAC